LDKPSPFVSTLGHLAQEGGNLETIHIERVTTQPTIIFGHKEQDYG